jgi:hypothetical protein
VVLSGRVTADQNDGYFSVAFNGPLAGRTLAGRCAAASLVPGAAATVAIRPEDIRIAPTIDRSEVPHLLGTIDALAFVGDRYEARVSLGDHSIVLLPHPRARVAGGPSGCASASRPSVMTCGRPERRPRDRAAAPPRARNRPLHPRPRRVGLCVVFPLVLVALQSLQVAPPGQPARYGLDGWRAALGEPGLRTALANTLTVTLARQLISLPAGGAGGVAARRTDLPGRRGIEFAFWAAFFLPPFTVTLSGSCSSTPSTAWSTPRSPRCRRSTPLRSTSTPSGASCGST